MGRGRPRSAGISAREDVNAAATERFWEERYRSADRLFSGNANATLVSDVAALRRRRLSISGAAKAPTRSGSRSAAGR